MALISLVVLILSTLVAINGGGFQDGFKPFTVSREGWEISAKHGEVWKVDRNQVVARWSSRQKKWVPTGGKSAWHIGASPDGWHWMTDNANRNAHRWNPRNQEWERFSGDGGAIRQISPINKDKALCTNIHNSIFIFENGAWKHLQGWNVIWAAANEQDDRWIVGTGRQVYRWINGVFVQQTDFPATGHAEQIDVVGDRVVVTTTDQRVFLKEDGSWKQIPGTCLHITMDRDAIYCTDKDHNIHWTRAIHKDRQAPKEEQTDLEPGECVRITYDDFSHVVCAADCDCHGH